MDTKKFAIQDWVDTDLLVLKRISTHDNESDTLTKNVGRTIFYRHNEYLMGKHIPNYVNITSTAQQTTLSSKENAESMGG